MIGGVSPFDPSECWTVTDCKRLGLSTDTVPEIVIGKTQVVHVIRGGPIWVCPVTSGIAKPWVIGVGEESTTVPVTLYLKAEVTIPEIPRQYLGLFRLHSTGYILNENDAWDDGSGAGMTISLMVENNIVLRLAADRHIHNTIRALLPLSRFPA
jgi:hypothetical protein